MDVKLGISLKGKNVAEGVREQYFYFRGESCITRSFIVFTVRQIMWGRLNQGAWGGRGM